MTTVRKGQAPGINVAAGAGRYARCLGEASYTHLVRTTVERRSEWNFATGDAGWLWTVAHPDGSKATSDRSFKTLKECVDDATQHGYVAWKTDDERRRGK